MVIKMRVDQYPTILTPYSACARVNPSNSSWSIRLDREKAEYLRYCSAFFAACSLQSAPTASVPYTASARENPSNSNCSISPVREKAEYLKYCAAFASALLSPTVLVSGAPSRGRST